MRITALNGSPKGDMSVTLQYVKYIGKELPGCDFQVFNVGQDIKKIEKKPERFREIIEAVRGSHGVVWSFPVYVLLVPSQLKRFIELIFESKAEEAFKGKYAAAITTSINFYDHTAHNYIHGVSEDLGMNYVGGFSAKMNDLLKPDERRQLLEFAENYMDYIDRGRPTPVSFLRPDAEIPDYRPGNVKDADKVGDRKMVLLTDASDEDTNLNRMIDVFVKSTPNRVDAYNLNRVNMKGGCLGCLNCGYDGVCVYKDEVMEFFNEKLLPAEAVIFAGAIKDRYLSSRWKMFLDRSFFNGHRPVMSGKKAGYIISGPLRRLPNTRQIIKAYSEIGGMSVVGIATDEYPDSSTVTSLVRDLSERVVWAVDRDYSNPETFLEVGAHKVFRDFVYRSRYVFKEDYDYYRENGLFDFPQKDIKKRAINTVAPQLLRVPRIRREFKKGIKTYMIKPLRDVLKE